MQAAAQKAKAEINPVLASVIKETPGSSPGRPLKIRRAIRAAAKKSEPHYLSDAKALAGCVAADWSRYNIEVFSHSYWSMEGSKEGRKG